LLPLGSSPKRFEAVTGRFTKSVHIDDILFAYVETQFAIRADVAFQVVSVSGCRIGC